MEKINGSLNCKFLFCSKTCFFFFVTSFINVCSILCLSIFNSISIEFNNFNNFKLVFEKFQHFNRILLY
jgi:hypothetical protein